MDTFLKNTNNYLTSVISDIKSAYQDIDQILYEYIHYNPEYENLEFFNTLLNNLCTSDKFKFRISTICKTIT